MFGNTLTQLIIFSPIVSVIVLTAFVLKVFSMQEARWLKRIAFWSVANLVYLPFAICAYLFVVEKYFLGIIKDNQIYLIAIAIAFIFLVQLAIAIVSRYSKGGYEKKVADVAMVAIVSTLFLILLFYREAYYNFDLIVYVDAGIEWVFFCLALYVLARILVMERIRRICLWKKIALVSGVISTIIAYHSFFMLFWHSEPNLDAKELLVCTNELGEFDQSGPWFKKSWRGVCVQHELCKGPVAETLQCDDALASIKKESNSWQRTKTSFLEVVPYREVRKGFLAENRDELKSTYIADNAYLFRTEKGAAFYYPQKKWVISGVDFDTFESLGGYYFKDKDRVFYGEKQLPKEYFKQAEFFGGYCLEYGDNFYWKGKKVEKCDLF